MRRRHSGIFRLIPHGAGFIVTSDEARSLGLGTVPGLEKHIRPYRNGRDLTGTPRGIFVIDLFGLQADDVRLSFPAVYQWLLERVKPERDQNPRPRRRDFWWRFAEDQPRMRESIKGLPRYIVTGQVAKHRVFQWLDASILPDDKLIAVASADALHLGVLSSVVHVSWALTAGGHLGVGNDPVYSKSTCFETFPFPDLDPAGELAKRIRVLAEQIDAHRKIQLAAHPDATLTATYNVLEKLRSGEALTAKEKVVHEHGLVGVLKSLHDELDAAVLQAYDWADMALPAETDMLLVRLVELNAKRASEEAVGRVRWLRPDFQRSGAGHQVTIDTGADSEGESTEGSTETKPETLFVAQRPWPAGLTEQIKAVADVLASTERSLDVEGLAQYFSGRGRWRDRLPTLLDTLVALGRARVLEGRWVDAGV